MNLLNPGNIKYGLQLVRMLNFDASCEIAPVRVEIAPTSACNYRCVFCKSHSNGQVKPEFISEPVLTQLFKGLKALKVKDMLIAGNGEPLLYKALPRLIKEHGQDFRIELLTNGSLLGAVDGKVFKSLAYLTVSLNSGNGKSHPTVHGYKGANQFDFIASHIERLLACPQSRRKIRLNYVITPENRAELPDFYRLAKDWGVVARARPDSNTVPHGKELYPCYLGFIQSYITAHGDVLFCCEGESKPLGNLYRESFKTIWQKKEYLAMRQAATRMHLTGTPLFPGCYGCDNAQLHSLMFHRIYSKIPFVRR